MTDTINPRSWRTGDEVEVAHPGHGRHGSVGRLLAANRRNAKLVFDDGTKEQVKRSLCRWVRKGQR